jgi:hypothetical protein
MSDNVAEQVSFPCTECSKVFKKKSNLKRHSVTHKPQDQRKSFFCDACCKSFLHQKHKCKKGGMTTSTIIVDTIGSVLGSSLEARLKAYFVSTTASIKTVEQSVQDIKFTLKMATQHSLILRSALPLNELDIIFESNGCLKQIIKLIQQQYPISQGSRGYALVAAVGKLLDFFVMEAEEDLDVTDEDRQKKQLCWSRNESLIRFAKKKLAKIKKEDNQVAHTQKNSSSSDKWLSLNQVQHLARELQSQMKQLDEGEDTTVALARQYQALLIVAFHVLAVPQRSQLYMQLQLGVTLLPVRTWSNADNRNQGCHCSMGDTSEVVDEFTLDGRPMEANAESTKQVKLTLCTCAESDGKHQSLAQSCSY